MNWHDIVYDPGSTTTAFKIITSDYKLEVLFSGLVKDTVRRVIVISLDNTPVLLASSHCEIKHKLFLDILQNSNTTPIGTRLFAPGSAISRGEMQVNEVALESIGDCMIVEHLNSLNIKDKLYYRHSQFRYKEEVMQLEEYILPGLKIVLDKYNK